MDPQASRQVPFTAAEAGPMLGIAVGTILVWRQRGYLIPCGTRQPARGRPALLFSWGDLMDCHARHGLDNGGVALANRD